MKLTGNICTPSARTQRFIRAILVLLLPALALSLARAQSPVFLPTVTTVAGNHTVGYSGDGGSALNATFSTTISNATTDPAGNIYIADTGDSVIRRVDAITGVITTVAGTGTAGYVASQDGGPATSAELNKPVSVRYHQGLLYIADSTNNRIRTLNLTTGIITTFAGGGSAVLTTGSQPITGTKGVSIPAPQDIAFDNTGDLYYTTQAGKPTVGRIVISTAMASLYAGSTSGGGYSGDGGLATKALLSGPIGIAVDAQNNLFIGDGGNKAVRRIDASTGIITTYMGGSSAVVCAAATDPVGDGCPAAQATLVGLGHISFDGTGALLVADPLNNRVRRIAPGTGGAGGIVTTIAGTGASPSTADGSYAVNTALGGPNDIELTPGGDLLVVERSIEAVRVIHVASVFAPTALGNTSSASTVFVQTQAASGTFTLPGATDFSGGAAPACTAGVHVTGNVCSYTLSFAPTLSGLRTTPLVFTDSNGSVRAGLAGIGLGPAASLLPGSMTTIAGTGTAGSSGDSSAATGAQLNSPSSVTFDGQGNLFIADSANNEVRMISGSGVITRVAGAGSAGSTGDGGPATSALLNAPHGITVDNAGNLYIADTGNNKIRFVDNLTGLISTYAGTGIASYIGDGGPATAATFNAPYGLSLTPQGVLYVADTGNNAIRSIASNSGLVTTFAGSSSGGFSGDGGAAAVAQLSGPKGVVSDASGNVYIADSGNNRIRLVNVSGIISTIAGQQGSGYTGDGSAAAAELYSPTGVAVDAAGTLYIADAMNHRLRVISEGQIATVAGTGTAAATGDGGSSVAATLNAPLGVALDGTGDVLIADSGNNKVRKISVGTNALAFPKTNPGDTTPAQTVALYNSGNQPLSLSSASIPSGYIEQTSSTSTNCSAAPLTLNPGASCVLQTSFQPPALGNYNGAITVTDNSESVSAATQSISLSAVSAYVFTPSVTLPGNTISGTSFTGTVSVSNPIATYTGTIHFTSSDPKAALPSDYTYALADNSSHNFSFTLRTAGIQCVTVTDISDSTVTATGCTVVAAGTPAAIAVYSGNNQSANVSTVYASRLAVQVTDASGNPVPKAQVIFTAPPSTASAYGTFPGASGPQATDTETTDLSGFANSAALTSGPNIGTFQVTASATGVSTPAAFNLSIVILGSFTLGPTSTQTGPLEPGISNTQIVNIVPTGGFSAPVTMTCKAPATITCTMTPSTVLFANGKPVNQPELSFQSEGPIGTTSSLGANPFAIVATIAMFLAMFRKRRSFRTLILGIAVAFALFGMGGCGNSLTPQTTPNGTYTVTVTGTAQTVSASTSVTYTIQR